MRISSFSKGFVLGIALLLSSVVFASNKGSLLVNTQVMVNGKALAPGEYSVIWDGTGPDVQVNFVKGKKVVATAQAHLVDLNSPPAGDSAIIQKNSDGTSSLAQIRFGRKKKALSLDGAPPQS